MMRRLILGPVPCARCGVPVEWSSIDGMQPLQWRDPRTAEPHRCRIVHPAPQRLQARQAMRARSAVAAMPDPVVWVEPVWLDRLGAGILWVAVGLTVALAVLLALWQG